MAAAVRLAAHTGHMRLASGVVMLLHADITCLQTTASAC